MKGLKTGGLALRLVRWLTTYSHTDRMTNTGHADPNGTAKRKTKTMMAGGGKCDSHAQIRTEFVSSAFDQLDGD